MFFSIFPPPFLVVLVLDDSPLPLAFPKQIPLVLFFSVALAAAAAAAEAVVFVVER